MRFYWLVRFCVCVIFLASGCTISTQITNTPRSSIEQRLLVRALERSFANLDAQPFKGKTVSVDFYGLTADKDFAKEYFTAWLQNQGVRIAASVNEAQFHLKVFAVALGVDQGQSFFGAPAFTVPLIGFVVPEIPLFKDIKHSGYAEIKIAATDAVSGQFINESASGTGKSAHDDYTVLVVIHFTRSDLETPNWSLGDG
ncbi:MAG TPA: hypothetical protein VMT22_10820 [Terriglobales bacterium]|nr:hypothetical protein [Terriglobales bacterium]